MNKVTIAIEMADAAVVKTLMDVLKNLPDVETVQWFNGTGEKGTLAVKGSPIVIIIDDRPETSRSAAERVAKLHLIFPHAAIFVVSFIAAPQRGWIARRLRGAAGDA